ncbi:MAG: FadR/GntR family transcriptional regulator [Eubacteriales bacterium]|nr:FadR/GntR family transcriptional regulator [Eubacteriales bacterium]
MNDHQQRLPEIVAQHIKGMIIDRQLNEGEQLPTETELTANFNVSRSTIREAVKILIAENVVEIRHGRGTYIAKRTGITRDPLGLSFADRKTLLPNLLEARRLMEPDIAALAAERRTTDNLRELFASIQGMELAHEKGEDYTAFDYRFHCTMAECTQNDVLNRVLPLICECINAGYMQTSRVKGSYERAVQWHQQIYEAILSQDPREAKEAMYLHLSQTLIDAKQNSEGET